MTLVVAHHAVLRLAHDLGSVLSSFKIVSGGSKTTTDRLNDDYGESGYDSVSERRTAENVTRDEDPSVGFRCQARIKSAADLHDLHRQLDEQRPTHSSKSNVGSCRPECGTFIISTESERSVPKIKVLEMISKACCTSW